MGVWVFIGGELGIGHLDIRYWRLEIGDLRLTAELENFGEDGKGDLLGGDGSEVESGRVFEAGDLFGGEVGLMEVLEDGFGAFFAGDQGDIGRGIAGRRRWRCWVSWGSR